MSLLPNADTAKSMLESMGLSSIEDLFADVPKDLMIDGLALPAALPERDVEHHISVVLDRNTIIPHSRNFLGGTVYPLHVPAAVDHISSRSEFYTAYTPYQPEASQGMLQALWEFQSLSGELLGYPVVNASMYDQSSALAEAVTMMQRVKRRAKSVAMPAFLPCETQSVIQNYTRGKRIELTHYGVDENGRGLIPDTDVDGIILPTPNPYGVMEDGKRWREALPNTFLMGSVDILSCAIHKPPGEWGADVAVSEGGLLGNYPNFGGPQLGLFACQKEHFMKSPGRLIGLTKDAAGDRAFGMALQSREQHIRRGRATSNICSNEALVAVRFSIYVALMGPRGLQEIATSLQRKCTFAREQFARVAEVPFRNSPHFNTFVVDPGQDVNAVRKAFRAKGFGGALPVDRFVSFTINEYTNEESIKEAAEALGEVLG